MDTARLLAEGAPAPEQPRIGGDRDHRQSETPGEGRDAGLQGQASTRIGARPLRENDDLASGPGRFFALLHERAQGGCAGLAVDRDHAGPARRASEQRDAQEFALDDKAAARDEQHPNHRVERGLVTGGDEDGPPTGCSRPLTSKLMPQIALSAASSDPRPVRANPSVRLGAISRTRVPGISRTKVLAKKNRLNRLDRRTVIRSTRRGGGPRARCGRR